MKSGAVYPGLPFASPGPSPSPSTQSAKVLQPFWKLRSVKSLSILLIFFLLTVGDFLNIRIHVGNKLHEFIGWETKEFLPKRHTLASKPTNSVAGNLTDRLRDPIPLDYQPTASVPFSLHFLVYSDCVDHRLKSQLAPLLSSAYDGHKVHLTIVLRCTLKSEFLDNITWNHGFYQVKYGCPERDAESVLHWDAFAEDEILFLFSSSSPTRISSDFFFHLKHLMYRTLSLQTQESSHSNSSTGGGLLDSLFGFSFNPHSTSVLNEDNSLNEELGTEAPILTQSISETCQIIFLNQWKSFWNWRNATLSDEKPSEYFHYSSSCMSDWKQSFYTYVMEKKIFNLHAVQSPGSVFPHICTSSKSNKIVFDQTKSQISHDQGLTSVPHEIQSHPKSLGPLALPPSGGGVSRVDALELHFPSVFSNPPAKITKLDACYRKIYEGTLSTNLQELKATFDMIQLDGSVICAMVSPPFQEMLSNWMCFVKELRLFNVIFLTFDLDQGLLIKSLGLHAYVPQSSRLNVTLSSSLTYGSLDYKILMSERTHLISQLLHLGFKILLVDVDAVWISNPFPYMQDKDVDVFAQLENLGNPCGGFLYSIPTTKTLDLWDYLDESFANHIEFLSTHPLRTNPEAFDKLLTREENVHEQFFLQKALREKAFKIKFKGLDELLFINGNDYFLHRKAIHAHILPVMIHNNFVRGLDNKMQRFIDFGLWRINAEGECKCLNIPCAL